MGLDIAQREYAQLTGIVSPKITPASCVQNLSHPASMVPFAAVVPRMSIGHMLHYTQCHPPGFQGSSDPQQVSREEEDLHLSRDFITPENQNHPGIAS